VQRPRTLFARITVTIALVAAVVQLFTVGVLLYFVLVPLVTRATDDLAARMVDSAREWQRRPHAGRADFEAELERDHALRVMADNTPLAAYDKWLPYFFILETALARRTGAPVALKTSVDPSGAVWLWADVPVGPAAVRVGFSRERAGIQPPLALLLILSAGALVTLVAAGLLAHRLTRPLAQLSAAAASVGAGGRPEPIPESGARELAGLAQRFNRMAVQVQELLDSRTVLLSGISHDLRTPLARIELASAMLCRNADPELRSGIERDITAMNELIGQYLSIGRGLREPRREQTDVRALLEEAVRDAVRGGATIEAQLQASCTALIDAFALRRIVTNLLDNALRYGAGKPVTLDYLCNEREIVVRVRDHGPGIPAEQREAVFRPFHRLEPPAPHASGGSGLGLALARQLAVANRWNIALDAAAGGGTLATLTIPLSDALA
jgi:two-component system osmolarity sensor histidine kinase EnvZ